MRAVIFAPVLAFLLVVSDAIAKPQYPAPGSFRYEDFSVAQKRRYEMVPAFTDSGRKRLSQLMSEGKICEHTGREIFLCKSFEKHEGTEGELGDRVQGRLMGASTEFLERTGDPELVASGDDYEEWQVPQPVRFNGKDYAFYRYVISQGLHKIFLGERAEETFLVNEDGALSYPLELPITESRFVYRTYFVLAEFPRE